MSSYAYAYVYPSSIINGGVAAFNPLTDINGLELYLNKSNATASSWLDQSPNAFDFVQATGTKQPTISANSVDFDGVDDNLANMTSNVYNGDASGIIFFSGYYNNTGTNIIISSSDNGTNTAYVEARIHTDGAVRFLVNKGGTLNDIRSTNTITNGAYYYGYIKSTGTAYEIFLNGTVEVLVVSGGSDNGDWFADILLRDNLVVGANLRSTNVFGYAKINKVIITNDYTISNTDDVNTFMSIAGN